MHNTRTCWCGNTDLSSFSMEFGLCKACGTLVTQTGLSTEQLQVVSDDNDFYSKQYWLDHQTKDLGLPDIHTRARNDLTERNLHWLKALLKYRLPPAKVLELGCAHGSFVALLRQAGYDASGVEMSPWVVEFGKKTFGIPVLVGPVEDLDISPGSLDVIALMDVLEHLPEPVTTMAHCLQLLKPDGLLIIQTPQFKEGMNYRELVETKGAFLEMLKADEHIYLFSDRSVTRMFQQLGAEHVQFEPAIFSRYDMFFTVSRVPLATRSTEEIEAALTDTPHGRLTLAMLDIYGRELKIVAQLQESEADHAARQEQVKQYDIWLKESQADRAARLEQIIKYDYWLKESQADSAARQEQVKQYDIWLKESQADSAARQVDIQNQEEIIRQLRGEMAQIKSSRFYKVGRQLGLYK